MGRRTVQVWSTLPLLLVFLSSGISAAPPRRHPRPANGGAAPARTAALPCGTLLGFQVLLDKAGFSSGQIDGISGANLTHALDAFRQARGIKTAGQPDCEAWRALSGDSLDSPTSAYTITDEDVKGPFAKTIPQDLVKQATLPALDYTSALEKLSERFHASPALLQRLNRGTTFAAGSVVQVPAVAPFNPQTRPAPDTAAGDVTIQVSKGDSALRAMKADGSVVFFAPVTTGSTHDPLPQGDYKVTGVGWHPVFHYNPNLFWDAKPGDTKATIKAGPNNPVGVAWVALSLEHYGIHGTPEPANIGHTESHGCVRLTNWDAARLAALVKPGTPVQFR